MMKTQQSANDTGSMPTSVAVDSKINNVVQQKEHSMKKKFLVLVERQYVIGHYVPILEEDAQKARETVCLALESKDGNENILSDIEDDFETMESEIDDLLDGGALPGGMYVLNPPVTVSSRHAMNSAGIAMPTYTPDLEGPNGNGDWSRSLVIRVEDEAAA
jgi:hypothetical protein